MKIGVLTSSRADYGIYKPLLDRLKLDSDIRLYVIAFGMHLQESQGFTLSNIQNDGYEEIYSVGDMPENDKVSDIAIGYARIVSQFADFWNVNSFDVVLALGDRWEMSAAVQASIPYQINIAHIHGGETTLGALDNIYRHQITLASKFHFTASEEFSKRVKEILGTNVGVFTTGSISLDGIDNLKLPDWSTVQQKFNIPFTEFILVTIHPETVQVDKNREFALVSYEVLAKLAQKNNIIITKANSDAFGSLFNDQFIRLQNHYPNKVKLIDSLGKLNYFSAMNQCEFMLGNTSSGIIEAASFKKWVINIGDRQKGRLRNKNVIDVPFCFESILSTINQISTFSDLNGYNHYVKKSTIDLIINIITKK